MPGGRGLSPERFRSPAHVWGRGLSMWVWPFRDNTDFMATTFVSHLSAY